MSKRQDRQGVRRPADIERKYNFNKQFSETRSIAEEARRIASDISETDEGLSLKVQVLENDIGDVIAQLDLKVETDSEGNLKGKVHVVGNTFTVDADNFKLNEDGTAEITGGKIGGWNLGKTSIYESPSESSVDYALYSDEMTETRTDSTGSERRYSYRVFLTAKGVYVSGRYDTSGENGVPYYEHKTWLELCGG